MTPHKDPSSAKIINVSGRLLRPLIVKVSSSCDRSGTVLAGVGVGVVTLSTRRHWNTNWMMGCGTRGQRSAHDRSRDRPRTLAVEKMKNTATPHDDKTTSGTIAEKVDKRESMPTLWHKVNNCRRIKGATLTQRQRLRRSKTTMFGKRRDKRRRDIQ